MAFLPLHNQEDLYRDFLHHICELYIRNGFYRLELKVVLCDMRSRNGVEVISAKEVVKITEEIEKNMQAKHPFFSMGLIAMGLKWMNEQQLEEYIRLVYSIDSHLIVGIDMVNEEDKYP